MCPVSDEHEHPANRRIDRIRDDAYIDGLGELSLDDLRARREECLAEREYLSLLRRLVQGRAEILKAEIERRGSGGGVPIVERLSEILAGEPQGPARGEALRVGVPEEEMHLARRRVERLVTDAGLSDPGALDDASLESAAEMLAEEERTVSEERNDVLAALDALQDELKRRYKEDPSLALT